MPEDKEKKAKKVLDYVPRDMSKDKKADAVVNAKIKSDKEKKKKLDYVPRDMSQDTPPKKK